MIDRLSAAALATAVALGAAAPAHAAIVFDTVVISNAIPDWLQVAELQAIGGSTNYALASNGASASITSIYGPDAGNPPRSLASNAIDGNTGGNYYTDYIAHSGSPDGTDSLTISLAGPRSINTLNIFGRTDCCGNRDRYNYSLLLDGVQVGSGTLDTAGTAFASASFGGVPEPTTWALMIVGIGAIGGALRRRGKVTTRVAYA